MPVGAMSRRVDAITLPSPTMMTRITLLCAAVALGVGSSAAAALPSARPTAVTRDVAVATITGHVTDATGRPLASAQLLPRTIRYLEDRRAEELRFTGAIEAFTFAMSVPAS